MEVPAGSVTAVMGPSGCGKSTLLRVVAGLQEPDAGEVAWDGESMEGVPPHRRGFGLMFQDYALFPHRSVRGNVAFGLRMAGWEAARIERRVAAVLELVGLAGFADRAIEGLSGGEQQRVALARTLAPSPRLLMLDEPIASLDRTLRDRLVVEMREIFAALAVTVLYVTHDQEEAFAVADRVAVMRAGRVVRIGTPQEVWDDPGTEFVARLLGHPNIVDVATVDGTVRLGTLELPLRLAAGTHRVVVPRSAVALTPDPGGPGRVRSTTFKGGSHEVEVEVGQVTLVTATPRPLPVGTTVTVEVDGAAVAVLEG